MLSIFWAVFLGLSVFGPGFGAISWAAFGPQFPVSILSPVPALECRQCRKWMKLPVGMPSLEDALAKSLCALIGHWSAASVLIRFSVWWIGFGVLRRWEGAQRAELRVFKR